MPEEIGVIVALVGMMVIIGIARPRFLNPINLFSLLGNTTFLGMLAVGMVFLLAIREIDLSVGWMFNFSAVVRGAADGGRGRSLAGGAGRHRCSAAGLGLVNGADRGHPSPARHHRHARHLFDVPGAVAGRQQGPRHRAGRPSQQLLLGHLDQAVRRRSGRSAGLHRAGDRHAHRPAPHALRLPGAGGRQQPGGRRACRHSDRLGAAADAGADGRDLRPVGRHVCRLPRRDRSQRGRRLRAGGDRRRDHRRHAAVGRRTEPSSAPSSA